MSRIDAPLATQIADSIRPAHSAQVIQQQTQQAHVSDMLSATQGLAPRKVSTEDMQAAAQQLKQVLEAASGKKFAFGLKVDEDTKDVIAEFTDDQGKVIKQIPSREMVELQARLKDLVGLFVDEKA